MPRSKIIRAPRWPAGRAGAGWPASAGPLPAAPVLIVAAASRLPVRSQTAVAIFVPPKSNPSTTGEFPTLTCQFGKNFPASYRSR
jgi:hypothetical protein